MLSRVSQIVATLLSLSTRNVRSIPSWLTSSNTWPLTERLRMLIRRLAVHLLTLCSFKPDPCRPHAVFGFTAAVSHQEDPRILPQLLCPLLHSGSLPASHDKMYFPLKDRSKRSLLCKFFWLFIPLGAFPAISWHVPEGECKGGGLQIHHGGFPQVRQC